MLLQLKMYKFTKINKVSYIWNKNKNETNFKLVYQEVMLGIYYFCVDFTLLAQEIGFHSVLKKFSRFHISYVIWDIIPDFCTDVGKTFLWEFQP